MTELLRASLAGEVITLLAGLTIKAPPNISAEIKHRIKLNQAMSQYPQSLAAKLERIFSRLPHGHAAIETLSGGGK